LSTRVYVRDVLGGGDTLVTIAYTASGGGSMLAALLLPRVLDRTAERTVMLAGGAVMAVGMAAGMLMPAITGLLAIWFVIGISSSLMQTPGGRLLRRSSHEEDRPALFAAQSRSRTHVGFSRTSSPAWLVTRSACFGTFGVLGLLVVVSSGVGMRLWPPADPEQLEHEHATLYHEHLRVHDEHHRQEHEGWEGPEPHRHPHRHEPQRHRHRYVIDLHHSTGRHDELSIRSHAATASSRARGRQPAWSVAPRPR
jgi:hypothetical protein